MKRNQKKESGEISPTALLIGASLSGHLLGVWLASVALGLSEAGLWALGELLLASIFIMVISIKHVLITWVLVTPPLSAVCMHYGINQKLIWTTLLGGIIGIPVAYFMTTPDMGEFELSINTAIWGAVYGGFTLGGFSFLSKNWGKPQR